MKAVFINLFFLIIIWAVIPACNNKSVNNKESSLANNQLAVAKPPAVSKDLLKFLSPLPDQEIVSGEDILIQLTPGTQSPVVDSVKISLGSESYTLRGSFLKEFSMTTAGLLMGKKKLILQVYSGTKKPAKSSVDIVIVSDIVPEIKSYEVINVYPHDKKAYTQGLVYDKGFIYEGTGLKGMSSLRKIVPETGELMASLNLPPDLFGEGICIVNNKIIQLTWTSGIGFVYDKESFKFLNKINYSTQGWGITSDGESLIMSDGSNKLLFLDPGSYTEKSRIEVYDNKKAVFNLNELEYINGLIYANIYTTDRIAVIDPANGKLMAYIDLKALLDEKDKHPGLDVLNGIAWDTEGQRLFLTGKNWPKLFEVRIVPPFK